MHFHRQSHNSPRLAAYVVGLLTVCLQLGLSNGSDAAESTLLVSDFQEARELARQQDLPIVLHFYTDWCGPCQQMDRTVFAAPQLTQSLAGRILLVKINADQQPQIASLYRVTSYPTDVYVDPQGRVLTTSIGVASLADYIANAQLVESRYRQSRQLVQARQESGNSPRPTTELKVTLGPPGPFPAELYLPDGQQRESQAGSPSRTPESQAVTEPQNSSTPIVPSDAQDREPEVVFVALDGYCPVNLKVKRQWVRGQQQFSSEYQQQKYLFATAAERDEFEKQPEKYAPRLLGCDAVIMWESDRALPGSTEFAAYYKEELYLFTSEQNREIFRIDPQRFIVLKHVLVPRDVEAVLIR